MGDIHIFGTRYAIYDEDTKMWSQGGYSPTKFTNKTKFAKLWKNIGQVKNHLNLVMEHEKKIDSAWRIVPINGIAEIENSISASGLYEQDWNDRKKWEGKENIERKKRYLLERKEEIERELKKYE